MEAGHIPQLWSTSKYMDTNRLHSLFTQTRTLTLGVTTPQGPWTAPVYFAYLKGKFYFLSNPESRHADLSHLAQPSIAASIFQDGEEMSAIFGVQMQGQIHRITAPGELLSGLGAYVKKFKFLEARFGKAALADPRFFKEKFHARLFGFTPEEIWLSDLSRMGSGRQALPLEVLP